MFGGQVSGQNKVNNFFLSSATANKIRLKGTFSTTAYEVGAWQGPCWKLPQVPRGVPKLANLMEEID